MKRFLSLGGLLAVLLLPVPSGYAQEDQYIRIYTLIQEGDSFGGSQQLPQAYAKYLEAQRLLAQFQRTYPDWNSNVVKYRLNYLDLALSEIAAKNPSATQSGPPARLMRPGLPVPAKPVPTAPPVVAPGELENQLAVLQSQVRQLETDKSLLESKLKEALRVQPAAADPRTVARAEQEIRSLKKENDLLKVNLSQRPTAPAAASGVDARGLDQLKQQLAEANRKTAEQADRAAALAAEKAVLQAKFDSLAPSLANTTNLDLARKALEDASRQLAEQNDLASRLALEKTALMLRVKTLLTESEAATALRAENEILKKQVADLKAAPPAPDEQAAHALAAAQAQIATLKSDQNILHLEKSALERRLKDATAARAAVPVPVPVPVDTVRLKQIERERDDLQQKLAAAQKEIAGLRAGGSSSQVTDLKNQIEVLRTRLAVMEAQKVPLSEKESEILKTTGTQAAPAETRPVRKTARDLPPGSMALVTEAQKDFAARRFEQAEEKYLKVLMQDDKNVYTLANLAAIQLEMGRLADAEKNIRQALTVAPDDSYSLSLLGFLKFRQNKYDDALDALSRAAKLDPQNAEIQNYLGLTLSQKGMRKAAESALRKAIVLDPNYGSAHYNLAVICLTQKPSDPTMARYHYQKALAAGLPPNIDMERMLNQRKTLEVAP